MTEDFKSVNEQLKILISSIQLLSKQINMLQNLSSTKQHKQFSITEETSLMQDATSLYKDRKVEEIKVTNGLFTEILTIFH